MIPYGRHDITQADIDAVVEVLRSEHLTQGPAVPRFEQEIAARVGAKHAVAVNSATSALHIACLALGLGERDLLWTSPTTYVASANCARYCNADVDFVDIDPDTWNISVSSLQEKLVRAERDGRLPKIVVPVHLTGQPSEQEAIWALAQHYGFKVLEDASHSIGASRCGEAVGSCRWADVAVFSFHPVKILTSAEGGMALTGDDEIAERMRMYRSHGITRDPAFFQDYSRATGYSSSPDATVAHWYYEQQTLGFNYRMTDIQAALGSSQLVRLDEYVARRNALASTYNVQLKDLPIRLPKVQSENRSAFHLYVMRLSHGTTAMTHKRVIDDLRRHSIGVNVHYAPVYLQPYYRRLGFEPGLCPEAESYGETAITLPLFPAMTEEQQNDVTRALRVVL